MNLCFRVRTAATFLMATAILTALGCKSANTQSAGTSVSGPPVFNASFQAREPRKCSKVTSPPSAAQAAALIQCAREQMNAHEDWITQNVQVELGAARPFNYAVDAGLAEIDTNSKVYPIRGSFVGYVCAVIGEVSGVQGKNCMKAVVASATGTCWKTGFGDWKCNEDGVINPTTWSEPPPPPVY